MAVTFIIRCGMILLRVLTATDIFWCFSCLAIEVERRNSRLGGGALLSAQEQNRGVALSALPSRHTFIFVLAERKPYRAHSEYRKKVWRSDLHDQHPHHDSRTPREHFIRFTFILTLKHPICQISSYGGQDRKQGRLLR